MNSNCNWLEKHDDTFPKIKSLNLSNVSRREHSPKFLETSTGERTNLHCHVLVKADRPKAIESHTSLSFI